MRTWHFLILTLLLGSFPACKQVSKTENENKQVDVVAKTAPLKLRLNNADVGTTGDVLELSGRLKRIFINRESEGVLREGTNEIETSVYLEADRSVTVDEVANLFGVLTSLKAAPILIPVKFEMKKPKPDPTMIVVYAGTGQSRLGSGETTAPPKSGNNADAPWAANGGIAFGLVGELPENGFPSDAGVVAVTVDSAGKFTMDGKQLSAAELKTLLTDRLKSKEASKRTVFVQAENYGNIEDIAGIAASVDAAKILVKAKNVERKENGISFSLSPAFFKDKELEQVTGLQTVRFEGPDLATFEVTFPDELTDKGTAESEIKNEFQRRKEMDSSNEVSMSDIDGASGILSNQRTGDRYSGTWTGFRNKDGKKQLVTITFFGPGSSLSKYEFLKVLNSIKFNQ